MLNFMTDLDIWNVSRDGKTLSYSQTNMVLHVIFKTFIKLMVVAFLFLARYIIIRTSPKYN